ncbi:hypothetical protein BH20ACI4_BH20ACI4_23280 [soil metagenome]
MLKKISISIAIIVCLTNEFIKGLYSGFAYGASKMCETVYPIIEVGGVKSWISHADPYFYIHNVQVYLTFALLCFMIIKLLENKVAFQIINFVPLILSFWFWFWIEGIKNVDVNDPSKYVDLLRDTAGYSWTIISLISVLAFLQIITVSKSAYKKYKTKLN